MEMSSNQLDMNMKMEEVVERFWDPAGVTSTTMRPKCGKDLLQAPGCSQPLSRGAWVSWSSEAAQIRNQGAPGACGDLQGPRPAPAVSRARGGTGALAGRGQREEAESAGALAIKTLICAAHYGAGSGTGRRVRFCRQWKAKEGSSCLGSCSSCLFSAIQVTACSAITVPKQVVSVLPLSTVQLIRMHVSTPQPRPELITGVGG
ncbi:uncharacterized protein V5649_004697 [Rhynchonycteris naso]